MKHTHRLLSGLTIMVIVLAFVLQAAPRALAAPPADWPAISQRMLIAPVPAAAGPEVCSPGARTLSNFGDRVYPDQGNGGYTSVHTDLYIYYDTAANLFLPGTRADLTDPGHAVSDQLQLRL